MPPGLKLEDRIKLVFRQKKGEKMVEKTLREKHLERLRLLHEDALKYYRKKI